MLLQMACPDGCSHFAPCALPAHALFLTVSALLTCSHDACQNAASREWMIFASRQWLTGCASIQLVGGLAPLPALPALLRCCLLHPHSCAWYYLPWPAVTTIIYTGKCYSFCQTSCQTVFGRQELFALDGQREHATVYGWWHVNAHSPAESDSMCTHSTCTALRGT